MLFSQAANANKKDITNINFKSSVAKGKIGKSYEIVKYEDYTSHNTRQLKITSRNAMEWSQYYTLEYFEKEIAKLL